jgi:uncharacterized protein YukE
MRISGGGGYGAVTGSTYAIKTMAVTPDSVSAYSAADIEQMFSRLQPAVAAEAGSAHTAASKTLANIADDLVKHVQVLNENWGGTAAQTAVRSFQQLHETAVGLAQASTQTGAVLTWLGETILPFYKNYKAPGNGVIGDLVSLVGNNPQNSAAQAVMARLNNRLVQANDGLPASLSISLPGLGGASGSGAVSAVGSAGAGAGQAASGVTGLAGGSRGGGVSGSLAGGSLAGGGVAAAVGGLGRGAPGAATTLASYSPPGGSGGAGAVPGGTPGGGDAAAGGTAGPGAPGLGGGILPVSGGLPSGTGGESPLGGEGGVNGDGAGLSGASLSGESVVGESVVGESVVGESVVGGAPGDGAVMGADGMIGNMGGTGAVTGDPAGPEMSSSPMMGSAAGQQRETVRRRQAWMAEDADVWEAAVDLAPELVAS